MASLEAMAIRSAAAQTRADRAASVLAAEFAVELPPRPARLVGNPRMARVIELEHHADVLELLVRSFGEVQETNSGVDPSVLDGKVADVREYLATVDDPSALALLLAAETGGKHRAGVLSAIEARQAELNAAAEESEE
jgi:hypothetical protein